MARSICQPLGAAWNDDRAELVADGLVHAIGVGLALTSATFLTLIALDSTERLKTASVVVYVAGLMGMVGLSAKWGFPNAQGHRPQIHQTEIKSS